jgi:phenylacetate-CoA ligase
VVEEMTHDAATILGGDSSKVNSSADLESRLHRQLSYARRNSRYYRDRIPEEVVQSPAGLRHFDSIMMTSKAEVIADQQREPPFGSGLACDPAELRRIFLSADLILPMTGDDLRTLVTLYASGWRQVGVGPGDIADVSSTYHLALGGTVQDDGFREAGAAVLPGGPGRSAHRLQLLRSLRVTVLQAFTPYAEQLAAAGPEAGVDPATELAVRLLVVGGELRDTASKQRLSALWGSARIVEVYGASEAGLVAIDCPEVANGMHVLDGSLVEIVDPVSGQPADAASGGEIVLTDLFRQAQPWIRCRTGDIVESVTTEPCPCGLTTPRLGRIIGRTGHILRVRGTFVDVNRIAALVADAGAAPISVEVQRPAGGTDEVTVRVAIDGQATDEHARSTEELIRRSVFEMIGIRCSVAFQPGAHSAGLTVIDGRQASAPASGVAQPAE